MRSGPAVRHATAVWLAPADARQRNPAVGTYTAWQAFVRQHPYASAVAPVSLGLCGNNPAVLGATERRLPARRGQDVKPSCPPPAPAPLGTPWIRRPCKPCWHSERRQRHLSAPAAPLHSADDVLALAEQWLQRRARSG
jgi:hypothetical protein